MYAELSQHDLQQLFDRSLILYKGKPTKVRAIGMDRKARLWDLTTQRESTVVNPYDLFQAPVLRIGMVNINGSVVYVERRPMRQYIIGFSSENSRFSTIRAEYPDGAEATARKASLLEDKSIAEAMTNQYPTLKECLEFLKDFGGARAFDHQFAIDSERHVFYRCQKVGRLPPRCTTADKIEFGDSHKYLKILLEGTYEKDLRTAGSFFSTER